MRWRPFFCLLLFPLIARAQTQAPDADIPDLKITGATESYDAASQEAVSRRRAEAHLPIWSRKPASWGVQVDFARSALGSVLLPDGYPDTRFQAFTIQAELMPVFLQAIGVISFGPSITGYFGGDGTVVNDVRGLWSWGGQVRYQARFFRQQPVVPYGGFMFQQLRYGFVGLTPGTDGPGGNFWIGGGFFGGEILLNFLEADAADEMYLNTGVKRSYLIAELRGLSGSDENFSVAGRSLIFGLRFEF